MLKEKVNKILSSHNQDKPKINKHFESSIKGLYIIGDLAGAPVIKYAMEQGYSIIEHIDKLDDRSEQEDVLDVLIAGAGASGLNAALSAKEKNMKALVLEKNIIASTIQDFPEGKWIYAEPDTKATKGKLWFDGARKEDIIQKWNEIIEENNIVVNTNEALLSIKKEKGIFFVRSSQNKVYKTKRIVIATGQRGNPRKLGIRGEDEKWVYHKLYSPRKYKDKNILIVGGGNSAIEAAITLSEQNKVYISYRKDDFSRIFKDNRKLLDDKVKENRITLILQSEIEELHQNTATIKINTNETKTLDIDYAFVLIGASYPKDFLKTLGIKIGNEWTSARKSIIVPSLLTFLSLFALWIWGGHSNLPIPKIFGLGVAIASMASLVFLGLRGNRYAFIGISFFIVYSIYGIKIGAGSEFWPYTFWGYDLFTFNERPWSFWYTVLYSVIMIVFGIQAMIRWGFNQKDQFQVWRYISLISFQVLFFFLIPEFLFQWAVEYRWLGESLSQNESFTNQSFRAYGIVYAWPLFFYTFFYDPHNIWIIWGVFLSFILIPIFTIFNGKRYCSWICGCGGLAETLGDRWRHLAPKGKTSIKWEALNTFILIFAVAATVFMLTKDIIYLFEKPASISVAVYRILVDVWLAGVLPITLYPFLGGRIWCRYFCPLAKLMELSSSIFSKIKFGRFNIRSNNKCISCGECSTNCQMGIDVMSSAMVQDPINNTNSSCVGCGICITVCPMDVLTFKNN